MITNKHFTILFFAGYAMYMWFSVKYAMNGEWFGSFCFLAFAVAKAMAAVATMFFTPAKPKSPKK